MYYIPLSTEHFLPKSAAELENARKNIAFFLKFRYHKIMNSQETQFLPISRKEMEDRGWDQVDFAYVLGDAYVDHPSFGAAIISRLLEANGYRVGIISQPDWKDRHSIDLFGRPRLGFLVSAGNMDSLVNHYTVAKKRRNSDA